MKRLFEMYLSRYIIIDIYYQVYIILDIFYKFLHLRIFHKINFP